MNPKHPRYARQSIIEEEQVDHEKQQEEQWEQRVQMKVAGMLLLDHLPQLSSQILHFLLLKV